MRSIYLQPLLNTACATLLSAVLLAPATAGAEPPANAAATVEVDSTTVYTFDDDEVFGTTTAPTGEVLLVRPRAQRESLVRARDHFVRELLHSVEEL
jgi:hypothetical protein